jgi:hypothetical protein
MEYETEFDRLKAQKEGMLQRQRHVVTRELMAFAENGEMSAAARDFLKMNAGIINAMLVKGDEALADVAALRQEVAGLRVELQEARDLYEANHG